MSSNQSGLYERANATGHLNTPTSRSAHMAERETKLPASAPTIEEAQLMRRNNRAGLDRQTGAVNSSLPSEMDLTEYRGPQKSNAFRKRRRPHRLAQSSSSVGNKWVGRMHKGKHGAEEFFNTFGIDPTGGELLSSKTVPNTLDRPGWAEEPQDAKVVALEARCEQLVGRLQYMENLVTTTTQDGGPAAQSKSGAGDLDGGPSMTSEALGAEYHTSIYSMGSSLSQLDSLFGCRESYDKASARAATIINTQVRGKLARMRFQRGFAALLSWRRRNAHTFDVAAKTFVVRQDEIAAAVEQIQLSHDMHLTRLVYSEWAEVTRANLPYVQHNKMMAQAAATARISKLRSTIFRTWAALSLGPHSRKTVTANYEGRLEAARHRLETCGKYRVVTRELLMKEMHRDAAKIIRENAKSYALRGHFRLWHTEGLQEYRDKMMLAAEHFARTTRLSVMGAWVVLAKRRADPTDGGREAARRRERFEQAHNLRLVAGHFRVRCLRKHLKAWSQFHATRVEVSRRFHKVVNNLAHQALHALQAACRQQRSVKGVCVAQWKEYAQRLLLVPFRAWYIYASERHARHKAQHALVYAYQNRQNRILKFNVFKMWRHQAIYGKVEGIHTRLELMKTLEDQRRHSLALEESVAKYQDTIEELEAMLLEEETKNKQKAEALVTKEQELQRFKFAVHNAEQEMVTAQGVLDSVNKIHSGTMRRIMAETTQLERNLTPVVKKVTAKRREEAEKNKEAGIGLDDMNDLVDGSGDAGHGGVSGLGGLGGVGGDDAVVPGIGGAAANAQMAQMQAMLQQEKAKAAAAEAAAAADEGDGNGEGGAADKPAQPAAASAAAIAAAANVAVAQAAGLVASGPDAVAVSKADFLLLTHLKWALSRVDFSAAVKATPIPDDPAAAGGDGAAKGATDAGTDAQEQPAEAMSAGGDAAAAPAPPPMDAGPDSHLPGLPYGSELHQLYSLFEFLRTGDTRPLLPANRPTEDFLKELGKGGEGKGGKDEGEGQEGEEGGEGGAGEGGDGGRGGKGASTPIHTSLNRAGIVDRDKNWNDFLQGLTSRFPPRRNVPVRERLSKRISHAKDAAHYKLSRLHQDPPNIYSSQQQNWDDISPRSPKSWSVEEQHGNAHDMR